ncbi:MAG: phosphoglucosamine mutase, partial [Acidobacteriota bacterium]|nr:phosphoglucosamine mutase [Acidobacteriota bacterium]
MSAGASAKRLFGTDGVRGEAGSFLSAELALGLARQAATLASGGPRDDRPQVLVIRDTRESGPMLEAAAAAGIAAAGADALLGGVLPTPAAPLLMRLYELDLAVVISASHNPYRDNGIKIFAADGRKLSDDLELQIEAALGGEAERFAGARAMVAEARPSRGADEVQGDRPGSERPGSVRRLHATGEDYLRALGERFRTLDPSGLSVVLDCANGATHRVAPEMFRRLGATVRTIADTPDGRNINAGCGSTHIEALVAEVRSGGHEAGFAFDGDGDRVLAVDAQGEVVDGDELMALIALHMKESGRLGAGGVVVTVMTNFGFHRAMDVAGVPVATTTVGDRYVLQELSARGWMLGGEQSGHVVDLSFNSSGDGIACALLALEALGGRPLSERAAMEKLPQRLVNVRVRDRGVLAGAG